MVAPTQLEPPVTPRSGQLPLHQLPWNVFESFCCALLNLHAPGFTFEHYGKQGDTQKGIDIFGHGQDGTRWVAQCKQVERFGPRHAKDAVEAMTFQADRYLLLLSCEATSGVRDVIHEKPGWALWDVKDISWKVRDLPPQKARRLVAQYFGAAWCEGFLGLTGSSALLAPSDYFARLLDETQLFHQAWPLVGREMLLDALDGLLGKAHDAALLRGRGGIGKTKVLYEWARRVSERTPQTQIFFFDPQLAENGYLADELPAEPCVLVVDDAHAARNLDQVLAVARRRPLLKLLLTCRPQASAELRSRLSRADFDLHKILDLEIPPLPKEEVLVLAQQGLGEECAHLAGKLSAISADSPLATVVGAKLVSERGLDPRLLSSDKNFKQQLFRSFEEIIVGEVSTLVERRLCQRLLQLLSALSPFDLGDIFLPQQASEFLEIDEETFRKALEALVEAGALLRTDNLLRITPDLLAEHIFQAACVDKGQSTGYAEKVFAQFAGLCPERLALNLAVLSWRLRETKEEPPGFLNGPWSEIKRILQTGSNHDRQFALRLVVAAAYHEPRRALECVEQLFHALYAARSDASQPLPSKLQEQAFTALWLVLEASESLARRCLDLIWQVGWDDPRPVHMERMHDHGVSVLFQIARYRPERSADRYGLVLDAIERWLKQPDVFERLHSPLMILQGIFQKQINLFSSNGDDFHIRPAFADAARMGPVRARALALVRQCARSGEPRAVRAAAECLRRALRNPSATFGEEPLKPEQWIPEQLEIIQILEQLVTELHEPICHHVLVNTLYPAITEPMDERVFERTLAFISAVPDVFELRLVRVLSLDLLNSSVGRRVPKQVSVRWPPAKEILPEVVREFLERFPAPATGYAHLQERTSLIEQAQRIRASAETFVKALAQAAPSYMQGFCEHALAQKSSSLDPFLPGALRVLRQQSFSWYLSTVRGLMASGTPRLRALVASSYASAGMAVPSGEVLNLEEEELRTLRALLADEQPEIRNTTVFWLKVLGAARDPWLVDVLAKFDVGGGDTSLASNLCGVLNVLHARGGIPSERLGIFLRKLIPIRSCPLGSIQGFLADVANGPADNQVFDLVLSRIQFLETKSVADFEPFPLERNSALLQVLGTRERSDSYLQAVLARFSGATAAQRRWLAELFNALSSHCGSPESLSLLREHAHQGDASTLDAVASILSHAPVDFVFDQFELTCRLVERANLLGAPCAQAFMHRLLQRAVLGVKEGDGRSSVPQGKERLKRARDCRSSLRLGSGAYPFYSQLCERLESQHSV